MDDSEGSVFLRKEPCPKCGSKDNLGRYSDGHGFCFGCNYHEPGDGETSQPIREKRVSGLIQAGEVRQLKARLISAETCAHFGYTVGKYTGLNPTMVGKTVHIAPYRNANGVVVAQHLRSPEKDFIWAGDAKDALMFGQHLWRDGGKMLVVTEGEIDCMTVSQLQGNKWPVVSIGCGAGKPDEEGDVAKVANYIGRFVDWLEKFEKVIFMFDMDEQGQASARAAASVLSPGKAYIASLPEGFKDPNELLIAGRGKDVMDAVWGAKEFRPDGVIFLDDILDEVQKPIEWGLPWWSDKLTKHTYGRRRGECVAIGAGTGIGKTDFITQQIVYDVTQLKEKVGLILLEQNPAETGKRLAGKYAGQRFHIPDAGWTPEELIAAVKAVKGNRQIALYNHFGQCDWTKIKAHIRFLNKAHGIRIFYLDHLTALADPSNERESLETVMAEMAKLCQELDIWMLFVSHLATPEGKPHEEGGRVMIRHFKGARAIGFWSHFMFGMERNQQDDDEELRKVTTFRILKDRYTGNSTGEVIYLGYDKTTGQLTELEHNPFEDETKKDRPHTREGEEF